MADEQLKRYKRAMEDALQQLDWCVGYLQGIQKSKVARVLAQNRRHIASDIAGEEETQLPTEESKAASE